MVDIADYISIKELANQLVKKGIRTNYQQVRRMCVAGKVKYARKIGGVWFVPPDAADVIMGE